MDFLFSLKILKHILSKIMPFLELTFSEVVFRLQDYYTRHNMFLNDLDFYIFPLKVSP